MTGWRRRVLAGLLPVALAGPGAPVAAAEGDDASLPPVAECVRALDGEEAVRLASLWDLWAHGAAAAEAVPAVAREFHQSVPLRRDAAFALAAAGEPGMAALGAAWKGADIEGRRVILRAMAYGASRAAPPEALLAEAVAGDDGPLGLAALAAVRRLGERGAGLAPAVAAAARANPARRSAALDALAELGSAGRDAARALLEDPDPVARRVGAEAATRFGPGVVPLVPALTAVAKGRDGDAASAALIALALAGPAAEGAVPALKGLLRERDPAIRILAARALAGVGRAAADAAPALTLLLREKEPDARVVAAEALGRVGPGPGNTVAALVRALRDDFARVRIAAAEALGGLGPAGGEASAALRLAAEKDGDLAVRTAAQVAHVAVNLPAEPVPAPAATPAPAAPIPAFLRARRDARTREAAVRRLDGEPVAAAVDRGIDWLMRHQADDGHWSSAGFESRCAGERCGGAGTGVGDVGVTGLALLALLAEGVVPDASPRGTALRKGVDWIVACCGPDGAVRHSAGMKRPYFQSVAGLVLVEAAAASGDARLRRAAQAAVDVVTRWRNTRGAWRYTPRDGDNDTSVASWAMPLLAEAAAAGLDVDPGAAWEVREWVDRMTDPEFGRIGYTARGNGPARLVPLMDRFPGDKSESCTAVGLCVRAACGVDLAEDPLSRLGLERLLHCLPEWNPRSGSLDVYYWRGGAEVAARVGGEFGRTWTRSLQHALLPNQRADGHAAGSWDPLDPWGGEAGRVYATAIAVLALQAPYRDGPAAGP